MNLMRIAHVPPVTVDVGATVSDAVRAMVSNSVGAVAVTHNDMLRGIFSERDVLNKVIYYQLDPQQTRIADVMTAQVESISSDTSPDDALGIMIARHFRHLPIVDQSGKVLGVLSIRNILQNRVEELEDSINSLTAYYSADGAGG
jgi:CBS domain-containing protein